MEKTLSFVFPHGHGKSIIFECLPYCWDFLRTDSAPSSEQVVNPSSVFRAVGGGTAGTAMAVPLFEQLAVFFIFKSSVFSY